MSPAAVLLADLLALKITLQPRGDKLRFHPRESVTPELLSEIKEHKAELLRLLFQPPGDLQAHIVCQGLATVATATQPHISQETDSFVAATALKTVETDSFVAATTEDAGGLPLSPKPRFRRLVSSGFGSFPHERMDPRVIADPVAICPVCSAARVLPELMLTTDGRCWGCFQREQQATGPKVPSIGPTCDRATQGIL